MTFGDSHLGLSMHMKNENTVKGTIQWLPMHTLGSIKFLVWRKKSFTMGSYIELCPAVANSKNKTKLVHGYVRNISTI